MIGLGKQGALGMEAGTRETPAVLIEEVCQASSFSARLGMCFITAGTIVNAVVYVEIVDTHLIESLEKLFPDGEDEFIFQHDLASAHKAKKTKEFFEQRNIEVLLMGIQLVGPPYHRVHVAGDEEESPGGSPTYYRGAQGHSSASLGKFHS